jgi:osmoprotectant transport system ATP-binding protein
MFVCKHRHNLIRGEEIFMIEFRNVTKRYGDITVLDDLSFTIKSGELVCIIGPSGCGKTTTLRTINRLIEPKRGTVFIDGKDITEQNAVQLRREIGYVIQQIGLFPNMTVAQNISVVPKLLKYSAQECDKIVHELLTLVDMPYEENAHKYPNELSGGQQQRIGVLRALAASPPIVLMDEPFGALDPVTRDSLQEEVKRIQRKLKKTIVFVTHDMDEALRLADTIIFMDQGKILQMASPEEMLHKPADKVIKNFLGRHMDDDAPSTPKKAEEFMKQRVHKVHESAKTLQSIERMRKREVNSLVVIDDDDKYLGTVSIEEIKARGKAGKPVSEYINTETLTVNRNDDAKEALDKLLSSTENYVIVLNDDRTVAGIITRTSTAKAMGLALWGEIES